MSVGASAKFLINYDIVQKIGGSFQAQAGATQDSIKKLSSVVEKLRGGDWVGLGATAFLAEMDEAIMPQMKRLAEALAEGDAASKEITRLQQEAQNQVNAKFTIIINLFSPAA